MKTITEMVTMKTITRMVTTLLPLCLALVFWVTGTSVKVMVWIAAVAIVVLYGAIPLIWHYTGPIQRQSIFLNYVRLPPFCDFDQPEKRGLPGTRNFFIKTEKNVQVGAWHILPETLVASAPKKDSANYARWFDKSLAGGKPVVLYLHGSAGSRAQPQRVELYDVLRKMDYHIIAFEYRGYADSSFAYVSESEAVQDAKSVYRYLKKRIGSTTPLFVWGHSLGSGISTHALRDLYLDGDQQPTGLVLEAPFNNMKDEIRSFFLTAMFRKMPNFDWLFVNRVSEIGIAFRTDEHIAYVHAPILILHSHNDFLVPFELGKKLLEMAKRVRPQTLPPVKFVEFDAEFGHDYICRAPDLPQVVRSFFREAVKK